MKSRRVRAFVRGNKFFFMKVKREVIERPERGGVMLCNCVAFVLALLGCDCAVSVAHENNTRAVVSFNLMRR